MKGGSMPIITRIYGIPHDTDEEKLKIVVDKFKKMLHHHGSEYDKKLKKDDVFIFFPEDLLKEGLGEEYIVFVDGFPFDHIVWVDKMLEIDSDSELILGLHFASTMVFTFINGRQVKKRPDRNSL
jgi:hypothetical protein